MKFFSNFSKRKNISFFALAFVVAILCAITVFFAPSILKPKAEGTPEEVAGYQTDGASVRVFEPGKDLEEANKTGIRFHVEILNTSSIYNTIVNEEETHERGSFKLKEGYKTYTLVVPTDLLDGEELTIDSVDNKNAKKKHIKSLKNIKKMLVL